MPAPPDFIYGTAWKEDRTTALTLLALRSGFRAFDTANQRRHYHEAAMGEALDSAYREGIVARSDLFLQTKYTSVSGQDHRLPYDSAASLALQVAQSLDSSLQHLGTSHVDSFLLHGPASGHGWTHADSEVWLAMCKERDAGRTHVIGVSNVSLAHLQEMAAAGHELPSFVQNRCFARYHWDRPVRLFCKEHGIVYQGFSLLTANEPVFRNSLVGTIALRNRATIAQVIFAFAAAIGILPITGTSSSTHMLQDLDCKRVQFAPEELVALESISGYTSAVT